MITEIISNGAAAQINSNGAELWSLKDVFGTEYLWQGNPEYWPNRAPVLFPFIGRLKDEKYTINGQEYKMGKHGFARDCEFRLAAQTKNSADFMLTSSAETLKIYPFPFQFIVSYTLEGAALTVGFRVNNTGDSDMLFCIGAHPAFNVPLLEDDSFENYDLEFEQEEDLFTRLTDADVFFNGETKQILKNERILPMTHALFDNDAIVPVALHSKSAKLRSRRTGRGVSIHFDGFKTLAFWSKLGNTPFICLEPWIGLGAEANTSTELKDKRDVITLPAQKSFSVSYTIGLL